MENIVEAEMIDYLKGKIQSHYAEIETNKSILKALLSEKTASKKAKRFIKIERFLQDLQANPANL